eukprot:124646_1
MQGTAYPTAAPVVDPVEHDVTEDGAKKKDIDPMGVITGTTIGVGCVVVLVVAIVVNEGREKDKKDSKENGSAPVEEDAVKLQVELMNSDQSNEPETVEVQSCSPDGPETTLKETKPEGTSVTGEKRKEVGYEESV